MKENRNARRGQVFTTGQVARFCQVAPRTVSKWFDSGKLTGYRIPGSNDRRIPRSHLVKFLKAHGMPTDLFTGKYLVHAAGVPAPPTRSWDSDWPPLDWRNAADLIELGAMLAADEPDVLVFDVSLGGVEGARVARSLPGVTSVAVLPEDGGVRADWLSQGFAHVVQRPFDYPALLGWIAAAAGFA